MHENTVQVSFLPCTNCRKWKKRCTIEWARSCKKLRSSSARLQRQVSGTSTTTVQNGLSPMDSVSSSNINLPLDDNLSGVTSEETSLDFFNIGLQADLAFAPPETYSSFPNSTGAPDYRRCGLDAHFASPHGYDSTTYLGRNEQLPRYADDAGLETGLQNVLEHPVSQIAGSEASLTFPIGIVAASYFEREAHAMNSADTRTAKNPWEQQQLHETAAYEPVLVGRAASPFTSQLLAEESHRLSIKQSLMKIYHDSMEGALSCWLSERNCPYTSTVFDGQQSVWSSNWANRIVTRVCELDTAYLKTGCQSTHDQQQASKVLNLVVMAFAAQWSQAGQRSSSRLPDLPISPLSRQSSTSGSCDAMGCDGLDYDVFGRDLQKSLWHDANRALGEASDSTSFRVILAGIIFSLTQRPIDPESFRDSHHTGQDHLATLRRILEHDGPPICLDIALRKLHDHQRKLEDARHAAADSLPMFPASPQLSRVHKETFGLLYWLAIMFDTLSAVVNRRPFTVSDTDSSTFSCADLVAETSALPGDLRIDLDGWTDTSNATDVPDASGVKIWGDYFLRQKSQAGECRKQNTRWPCAYTDAASCLADAAPVKVLLFRRVAHLQDLFYQHAPAEAVERCFEAAMEVHRHWNKAYGRFIDDCVRHHESLPPRIQSWYILLAGHWNLAVLILSDLIQKMDDAHRTMPCYRRSRESIDFTGTLRGRAVFAISELGRCSRYSSEDLTFSLSPDFHHAVNKAALLTEPWTMVLVRSFGYAGAFLAKQVTSEVEPAFPVATGGSIEARERLQYCIDALWLIGKKSDMALCAAKVLQQAVE